MRRRREEEMKRKGKREGRKKVEAVRKTRKKDERVIGRVQSGRIRNSWAECVTKTRPALYPVWILDYLHGYTYCFYFL
jgi:hypothetical protein